MSLKANLSGHSYLNTHTLEVHGNKVSFLVHYWGATPVHYDNPVHKHSFFEVCYVLDGEGTYLEHGIEFELKKDRMFLSRPGISHQIRSQTGLFLLFVAFEVKEGASSKEGVQLFRELAQTECFFTVLDANNPSAELWNTLITHAAKTHFFKKEILVSLANALLCSFYQTFTKYNNKNEEKLSIGTSAKLHQAKLFIEDNLAQSLTLEDVASYLHISPRHVTRLFSENQGEQGFSAYVRKKRIHKAVEILMETDFPIKEIAHETGFSSVHYFTKVFTKEIGVSPGEFRKKRAQARIN